MAEPPPTPLLENLPLSMAMAAFIGIAWYVGTEINLSLFLTFRRPLSGGIYFWSCALSSWGVLLQPLFIVLCDFGIWKSQEPGGPGPVIMIYLTWMMMVVPQSWVLWSRLHLIVGRGGGGEGKGRGRGRGDGGKQGLLWWWLRGVLVFNSVVFSVPTVVMGTVAQTTTSNPNLLAINLVWDRLQLTVFFVQETILSLIYIYQARKYLRDCSILFSSSSSSPSSFASASASSPPEGGGNNNNNNNNNQKPNSILRQLVFANVLIICLDVALLAIQCHADLFYLQGAFKPCVYGVKLKVEFVILNRLVKMVQGRKYMQQHHHPHQQHHQHHQGPAGGGGGEMMVLAASPASASAGVPVVAGPWSPYQTTATTTTMTTMDEEREIMTSVGGGGKGLRSFKSQESTEPILKA